MKKKILFLLSSMPLIIFIFISISFYFYPDVFINKPNYIEIYNEDEKIYSLNKTSLSNYTELKDVSSAFIKTLINTEDKNFYKHKGLDYLRILKSIFINIEEHSISQGGSTLTQQLARTLYLSNKKSWNRKIHEIIIAKKIENKYSKNYILELYINSVYFAHNLYGISSASNYYFNKTPLELNYQESCLLVGVINAPNIYSPFINFEKSLSKQKTIAYSLFINNIISAKEYYDIISHQTPLYGIHKNIGSLNYYHQGIEKELNNLNISNDEQGLSINTYLDYKIQKNIDKIISSYEFEDEVSVIVMKPYSGKVVSLIGGKDYTKSQFNRALDGNKQIGSTIKPIIYYLGLLNGMTPLSEFTSQEETFNLKDGSIYKPQNAGGIYANRKINMVEAIAMSDNIYSVKTSIFVGTENIKKLLNSFECNYENINLSVSLGGIEMSPLKLISIYNTFASEGKYYSPKFIKTITRGDNVTLYQNKNSGKTLLSKDETLIINHLLKSPFDKALATYSSPTMKNYQINTPFACKTGTTSSSSWVVGFNKDYTVLVYVGDDENKSLKDGYISRKIFKDIITILTNKKEENFYSLPSSFISFQLYNPLYNLYSKIYIRKKY